MAVFFYVACDGGQMNTLSGGGGILEIQLRPSFSSRYFAFPNCLGGSTHMVMATPQQDALVASSANVGQILVIPRRGDTFAFEDYRAINTFASIGPPRVGHDSQTAMFDFLDNTHIVAHYNRKLLSVDLQSGQLEELCDIHRVGDVGAGVIHQIAVTKNFIITNNGALFALDRRTNDLFAMSDGFLAGHFLAYEDETGDTIVIRPSFNISGIDGHLKVDDNTISFFNLNKRTVRTLCYGWERPDHFPTEVVKEGDVLYMNYAVPGSVCKVDARTGRVTARMMRRPSMFVRYSSMMLDMLNYLLDYGTLKNREEHARINISHLAHAFKIGAMAGTRAGFFAMGFEEGSDEFYVCHRGLNTVYCLGKDDLSVRWQRRLPGQRLNPETHSLAYRWFPYFRRCLGMHHGCLVYIGEKPGGPIS